MISTDALHHDMDATIFGDPAGQIPRMDTLSFPADEKLVKKAVAANEKANPDIHTFTGRVVSGDQFISDKDVKNLIIIPSDVCRDGRCGNCPGSLPEQSFVCHHSCNFG